MESAAYWFRRAADEGNVLGMVSLGICTYEGRGIERDTVSAVEWFRKAADLGAGDGLNSLAVCSLWGEGVEEDPTAAISLFEQAAGLGNGAAMVNLGHCCYWGMGLERNVDAAKEWYSKAADSGDVYGMFYLGNVQCEKVSTKQTELSLPWQRQAQEQELLMGVSSWPIPITRGGTPDALAVPVLELPAEAEGYGNTYN